MSEPAPFLSAQWRHLAMLNYAVDPALLAPLVPHGTELDSFAGRTYVSMVGFLFLDTRVRGFAVPFHRNFEEVNLRFYLRRQHDGQWRRGVAFVKELVPRWAIAWVARRFYGEPYQAVPMSHLVSAHLPPEVRYEWRIHGQEMFIALAPEGDFAPLVPDSEAAFIAEHYWGYAGGPGRATIEYQVEHPPWRVARAAHASLQVDAERLYGARFVDVLSRPPDSAFLAEGSAVTVRRGRRL